MYGICNHCSHKEETTQAFCPLCNHPWNIFLTKPKKPDLWIQRKGWLNRVKRSLPPWAVRQFIMTLLAALAMLPLDILAYQEEVRISRWNGFSFWAAIIALDLITMWFIYRTMRFSLKGLKISRFLVTFNLGGTLIGLIHNWTRVIDYHTFAPAGLFLTSRLILLLYICWFIWLNRIERALVRHNS